MASQKPMSLRAYLMSQVMLQSGCAWPVAIEAVSSTAIEHPEWNLDELKTWDEWEQWEKQRA